MADDLSIRRLSGSPCAVVVDPAIWSPAISHRVGRSSKTSPGNPYALALGHANANVSPKHLITSSAFPHRPASHRSCLSMQNLRLGRGSVAGRHHFPPPVQERPVLKMCAAAGAGIARTGAKRRPEHTNKRNHRVANVPDSWLRLAHAA